MFTTRCSGYNVACCLSPKPVAGLKEKKTSAAIELDFAFEWTVCLGRTTSGVSFAIIDRRETAASDFVAIFLSSMHAAISFNSNCDAFTSIRVKREIILKSTA